MLCYAQTESYGPAQLSFSPVLRAFSCLPVPPYRKYQYRHQFPLAGFPRRPLTDRHVMYFPVPCRSRPTYTTFSLDSLFPHTGNGSPPPSSLKEKNTQAVDLAWTSRHEPGKDFSALCTPVTISCIIQHYNADSSFFTNLCSPC